VFKLALSLVSLVVPLSAGDLAGKWSATLSSKGREILLQFEFCRKGADVVGAFGMRGDFLAPLEKMHLAGSTLSFELRMPMSSPARFEGLLEGDRISGQLTSDAAGPCGRLEMKRTGPPSRLPVSLDRPAAPDDLAALSDEFDHESTLKNWSTLTTAEGWTDRVEKADVNETSPGRLYVVPKSGAWWAGYHGVYFFKEVRGDFVLTTRVNVTGRKGGEPSKIWTISGLLVRAPTDAKIPRDRRKENWVYVMTGRGPAAERVIDAKSTLDGNNAWDITPAHAGWYDLRIARLGPLFLALCRPDGGDWVVRKRIVRDDLPETLQAGINITSDFDVSASMPSAKYNAELFPGRSNPDSATRFEFVRFGRPAGTPAVLSQLAGKEAVGVTDADLLALFR
jgi:hypothetical protein